MNSLLAMFGFELKRLMTPARLFWWVCVAAFPVCIVLLLHTFGDFRDVDSMRRQMASSRQINSIEEATLVTDAILTIVIYYLAPGIACMLGALLTASPAVASELEQHSWIYFATRPNGLFHLVVGKYLVAFVWAATSTLTGLWISIAIADINDKWNVLATLTMITLLSAMSYSALYMMIGTLFYRRAMIFCVAYTAGVEIAMSFVPAVVNRLTIQYRLRALLFDGMSKPKVMRDEETFQRLFIAGDTVMQTVFWLVALTAVFLAVALTSVQVREFTGAAETEST